MTAKIIDGKAMAKQIREEAKAEAAELTSKYGMPPGLEVILIGDDPASAIYVRNKGRASEKVGIRSQTHPLPATVTTEEVLDLIDKLKFLAADLSGRKAVQQDSTSSQLQPSDSKKPSTNDKTH